MGYSPLGCKELDRTGQLTFSLYFTPVYIYVAFPVLKYVYSLIFLPLVRVQNLSTIIILDCKFFCGSCSVFCRVFSNRPCFHPLDASRIWRPVGFDCRSSTGLGKQTVGRHRQNLLCTRTQEKVVVTP